jgi:hypothetical protein
VPLKDLAMGILMGASDSDSVSSLAGRLARLDKQLDADDKRRLRDAAGGVELSQSGQQTVQRYRRRPHRSPRPRPGKVCQSGNRPRRNGAR